MARISEKERAITPIYFQTRRESKFSIPPVPLPPENSWEEQTEKAKELINRGLITREEFEEKVVAAGFYINYDKEATKEVEQNLRRPNEGLYF